MADLLPVALGGDIGVYALLRAFHEEYAVTGIAIASVPPTPLVDSRIVQTRLTPDLADAEVLVETLVDIAREHPDRTPVLVTNADWFVRTLIQHRERLEAHYLMAFCDARTFDEVSDKESFARICDELAIPTPRTVSVDIPSLPDDEAVRALPVELTYPLVAKPASSADYHYVDFPGKKKIHDIESRAELDELLMALRAAHYGGTFLVQEFIPGDETQMRSLTAYRDGSGTVTLLSTGRVLLEEHTPDMLGVPAAILTEAYPDAMDAAAAFLDRVDYHGFANFDYKHDPRTGRHVFFEVNPRIGRNNYYVTAAGANVARFLVADVVEHRRLAPVRTEREVLYSVVPLHLLLRYLPDAALRQRVRRVIRQRHAVHPLRYRADGSVKRRATILAVTMNFYRKYRRHYPRPTATGR